MSKGGAKVLEMGPEMGGSRKDALRRLLEVVEAEVGRRILRDERRKGDGSGSGNIRSEEVRMAVPREGGGEGRGRVESGVGKVGMEGGLRMGSRRAWAREDGETRDRREGGMRREGVGGER